ncbi:uncharacterized protein (DUF1501 family) [Litorivivens lipolytica]|uniref:Uncharacterized protein (DUF1501 family) n=1 Tax=Litorivivens lipolytica TaxID=1524264 RepID=A0A7W4W1M8_9GAMM|nr:DUF1501 domain-containing protein [Litorivivens lipolytica]MBB3045801.1 uncharacterized protein (DUF1501 family) [Litorivivens lipolytica]
MTEMNRRNFLQTLLGGSALAATGGVGTLYSGLARAAAPAFDDYKALVIVYLYGGNDAFNMTVPRGTGTSSHDTYAASRGSVAISDVIRNPGRDLKNSGNPYDAPGLMTDAQKYLNGLYQFDGVGFNALMPELAQLYADKRAAVVANVGSLIQPVVKEELHSTPLPPFLYAHNHQTRAMETGWADNLSANGWAGRLADLWEVHQLSGVNGGSPLGLNVSFSGNSRLQTGSFSSAAVMSPNAQRLFTGNFNVDVFRSLNEGVDGDHPIRRVLHAANRKTADLSDIISEQFAETAAAFDDLNNSYGQKLFSNPDDEDATGEDSLNLQGRLSGQALRGLKAVARMIKLSTESLGLNRQIFYVGIGGFDNHSALTSKHPLLLRELSLALSDFTTAMDHLGLADQVMVGTLSDFGRTLGNNGDGTDHAWAGNNILLGGGMDGGRVLGDWPDLTLSGESDTAQRNGRGRLIPTTSVDQYLATLCSWFGVEDDNMSDLFPNLQNFATGSDVRSAYLALQSSEEEPSEPGLPLPSLPGLG